MSSFQGFGTLDIERPRATMLPARPRGLADAAQVASLLGEWLGSPFAVLDASSGEWLRIPAEQSEHEIDWGLRGALCQQVARRGRCELLDDEEPLLTLAIPVPPGPDCNWVALGHFLSRPVSRSADLRRISMRMGCRAEEARQWAAAQAIWDPTGLIRAAELARSRLEAEASIIRLQGQIDGLSDQLGSTYEEITLIYRLTQNLGLTSDEQELCRMALGWLADALPVEGLAILLAPATEMDEHVGQGRAEHLLLTHGETRLGIHQFQRLIEHVGADVSHRPVVVNRMTTESQDWPLNAVRQLVLVPLGEGERVFGWLAAINHSQGAEFGTVEANLLSSVGTILGIHSGNTDLYRQQSELLAGVVRALTSAIDAKDPYTCGHSDRVARVAVRLAEELHCDTETLKTIYFAGLLHDVGKIGIDDLVLRKPGKLTEAEFDHIKTHVEIGHRILRDLRKMARVLPIVLHHHESWNGKGYPYGLAGENIPYLARIVAVADAFDAMASDRPYRRGMDDAKLDAVLHQGAGQQWDPRVVEAFFSARDDIRGIMRDDRNDQGRTPLQLWK